MSKLKKLLILKKGIGIVKNYLNKMKILVMNSITFKIPILIAVNMQLVAVKIGILNVIEFITTIFILFK